MDIHAVVTMFETVLHEHTGMGYFVDLLLKSLFVLVLMVVINLFTRRFSASLRHLVWSVGFISLASLPLFIGFLPKIHVPITATETFLVESTVTSGIVNLADNISLVMGAWWNAFLGVYLTLLAIQVCYILLGMCKVFSLSRSAVPVNNRFIHQELENLILEEGLTVSVGLQKSREVFSPISWGLFSPEIILPEQAESWGGDKIRSVLIHELSHIQRLDWLTSLIVRISRAIYWYNPLVWYAARKLDEEAEQACDDAVILNGHCHNEYASNLLEIASHARLGNLGNTLVQAIAGSFLGSRVFSILDTSRKRQKTEVVWVVRGILMGFTVIAILGSLRLVPLVNVSSIDPHASTAFSIIFVPSSEASTSGGYEGNLYNYEGQEREVSPAVSENRSRQVDTGGQRKAREPVGLLAASNDGQAGQQEGLSVESEKGPSLLDEFINARGEDDSKSQFENYVNEYTNGVIRNVQSGIDLSSFDRESSGDLTGGDESTPVAIKIISPEYPRRARQRGLEGYSIVEYNIGSDGKVLNPVIVESRPGTVFNRNSIKAIQNTLFEPPTVNGEVVSLQGRQTKFVYQLKPG